MARATWSIAWGVLIALAVTPAWGGPDAPPTGSLFSDPVATGVGDLVLVHLSTTSLQATVGGQSTTTMNSPIVSLISQQGLQSSQNSATTWQHALTGDLAMRVTGVTPAGLMQLQGSRQIKVDETWQTLTITGLVRPQDLAADDSVSGSRLADVVATMTGRLNTTQRLGLWDVLALIFGVGILLKLLP